MRLNTSTSRITPSSNILSGTGPFLLKFHWTPRAVPTGGTYPRIGSTGMAHTTPSSRGWGIFAQDGSGLTHRLMIAVQNGGTQYLLDQSGANMSVDTLYQVVIQAYPASLADPPGLGVIWQLFMNGVYIGETNTSTYANSTPVNLFQWGQDPDGFGGIGAVGDVEEIEVISGASPVLTLDEAQSLYNSGVCRRLRDIGLTPTHYLPAYTGDTTGPLNDAQSAVTYTLSGITRTDANRISHAPMYEAISKIRANAGVFEDFAATDAAEHGDRVAVVLDQSGRKLRWERPDGNAGERPKYLLANRAYPGIYFDAIDFDDTTTIASAPKERRQLRLPSNTNFDQRNFTAIVVASAPAASGTDTTSASNNDFLTFGTVSGEDTGRFQLWSNRGDALADANLGSVEQALFRPGQEIGTTGTRLYTPTSPTVYAIVGTAGGIKVYVGRVSRGVTSGLTAFAANAATAAAILGTRNAGSSLDDVHAGIYVLHACDIYNRSDMSDAELDARMAAMASEAGGLRDPIRLGFGLGSSTMQGNSSATDAGILSRLWHRNGFRSGFLFNLATGGSKSLTDVGTTPSTERVINQTLRYIVEDYPGVPVDVYLYPNINDLADGASSAQCITNLRTLCDAIRTWAPNAFIIVGSVLPSEEITAGEETARLAYNAALFTDSGYRTKWNAVADQASDPQLQSVSLTYYRDETLDKHLIDAGFDEIQPYWNAAALLALPAGGRVVGRGGYGGLWRPRRGAFGRA